MPLIHSKAQLLVSFTPLLNRYEASTGTRVSVRISAPIRANDMVSAMGWKSLPEGPLSVDGPAPSPVCPTRILKGLRSVIPPHPSPVRFQTLVAESAN